MQKQQTILKCSQLTAFFLFVLLGLLFILAGCFGLYKAIGLSDEQATAQVEKDQAATQIIADQVRFTTTEIVSSALAGLGAIASGFLAKWLGSERKMTTVLIQGIEESEGLDVKTAVKIKAGAAGIQPKLDARVQALT